MTVKLSLATLGLGLSLALAPAAALATTVVVDAKANSSSGGVGLASGLTLTTGETFTISASTTDLWSAGDLPRWSNGDGLTANLYATGSDESGQASGTLIGQDFGLWTENSLSAPYGSLVGEIGGVFEFLGTSFSGSAWGNGPLSLFYWDSNFEDNSGSITVTANVPARVPEPITLSLFGAGLVAAAGIRRRKKLAAQK